MHGAHTGASCAHRVVEGNGGALGGRHERAPSSCPPSRPPRLHVSKLACTRARRRMNGPLPRRVRGELARPTAAAAWPKHTAHACQLWSIMPAAHGSNESSSSMPREAVFMRRAVREVMRSIFALGRTASFCACSFCTHLSGYRAVDVGFQYSASLSIHTHKRYS